MVLMTFEMPLATQTLVQFSFCCLIAQTFVFSDQACRISLVWRASSPARRLHGLGRALFRPCAA